MWTQTFCWDDKKACGITETVSSIGVTRVIATLNAIRLEVCWLCFLSEFSAGRRDGGIVDSATSGTLENNPTVVLEPYFSVNIEILTVNISLSSLFPGNRRKLSSKQNISKPCDREIKFIRVPITWKITWYQMILKNNFITIRTFPLLRLWRSFHSDIRKWLTSFQTYSDLPDVSKNAQEKLYEAMPMRCCMTERI